MKANSARAICQPAHSAVGRPGGGRDPVLWLPLEDLSLVLSSQERGSVQWVLPPTLALDDAIGRLARQIEAALKSEQLLVNGDQVAMLRRVRLANVLTAVSSRRTRPVSNSYRLGVWLKAHTMPGEHRYTITSGRRAAAAS